jgi:hypothetical protein
MAGLSNPVLAQARYGRSRDKYAVAKRLVAVLVKRDPQWQARGKVAIVCSIRGKR